MAALGYGSTAFSIRLSIESISKARFVSLLVAVSIIQIKTIVAERARQREDHREGRTVQRSEGSGRRLRDLRRGVQAGGARMGAALSRDAHRALAARDRSRAPADDG